MNVAFTKIGWSQYVFWQHRDPAIVARTNLLIENILRDGQGHGLGKPEPLRGDLSGWWSRRITREHRLVYRIRGDVLEIASCRYHYQR